MMPAHITRLMTFAQHGEPKGYAASDMMRADLEVLILGAAYKGQPARGIEAELRTHPAAQPAQPVAWRYKDTHGHWRYVGNSPRTEIEVLGTWKALNPEPLYAAPQPAQEGVAGEPQLQKMIDPLKDAARYLLQNGQTRQGLAVQACVTMLEDDSPADALPIAARELTAQVVRTPSGEVAGISVGGRVLEYAGLIGAGDRKLSDGDNEGCAEAVAQGQAAKLDAFIRSTESMPSRYARTGEPASATTYACGCGFSAATQVEVDAHTCGVPNSPPSPKTGEGSAIEGGDSTRGGEHG